MKSRLLVFLLLAIAFGFLATDTLFAQLKSAPGDWPGWRGPDRTGISPETGLLQSWPKDGPPLAWKVRGLGRGHGTVSLAAGKIYVIGSKGRAEYLRCLDAGGGKELWAVEIGAEHGQRPAPRSTPTVDGGRVYTISSNGKVTCVDAAKGEVVWQRDMLTEFRGNHGNWAYAESPLIDGDRLICTPGGDGATIVCLDKADGKDVWRSSVSGLKKKEGGKGKGKGKGGSGGGPRGYSTAGYSSAVVAETGGVRQYVQFLDGGVVGVRASDGKLLWHYDDPGTGNNANCSSPIFHEDSVFAAAGYGVGGGRAKVVPAGDAFKAEQLYFVRQMQNHHGGMVLVDGHVYGTNNSGLVCVEFKTGQVKWAHARGVGKGSVVYADGHLYHRGERGDVALVEANPGEYKEKGRLRQPERSDDPAWAHPVIAGGKLYLRDADALFCYDVKAK
jgi:outer membrane protein assembly factor BamB